MTPILTAGDVVRRIAVECAYVDDRGSIGIRLKPAVAIVRQYGEQFRLVPARQANVSPIVLHKRPRLSEGLEGQPRSGGTARALLGPPSLLSNKHLDDPPMSRETEMDITRKGFLAAGSATLFAGLSAARTKFSETAPKPFADAKAAESWMDEVIAKSSRAPSGVLRLSRFVEPMWFLTAPIGWRPNIDDAEHGRPILEVQPIAASDGALRAILFGNAVRKGITECNGRDCLRCLRGMEPKGSP